MKVIKVISSMYKEQRSPFKSQLFGPIDSCKQGDASGHICSHNQPEVREKKCSAGGCNPTYFWWDGRASPDPSHLVS